MCVYLLSGEIRKRKAKFEAKSEVLRIDSEKLPYKLKRNLIRLVGERPLINCYLNGMKVEGLWDTGAMISLVDTDFVEKHFPDIKIDLVADFLGDEELLLTVANKTELSVKGYYWLLG